MCKDAVSLLTSGPEKLLSKLLRENKKLMEEIVRTVFEGGPGTCRYSNSGSARILHTWIA